MEKEEIRTFLLELELINSKAYKIIIGLRKIILAIQPRATERIMYGGNVFSNKKDMFCGIFAYKNHVSIEFSNGYLFDDPKNFLEGKGKFRRHIKLKSLENIINKDLEFYIRQTL